MRRIPRPLRATDPSSAFQSHARPRVVLPPCRSALATCTQLRTSTAAFSTTPSNAFLLPSSKQDKKKHQQFVRRWQKRLLGDSEPIGARVDPYDPTSPVRIAPEEQGEEEEVLEDSSTAGEDYKYMPVQDMGIDRPGNRLMHVGGPEWLKHRAEVSLAKDFEKLMGRTYTPLGLRMAYDIENMTGTQYTLRDDNLMLGQTVEQVTQRPYTNYNFGLLQKVSKPHDIYPRFKQAVAEMYTLQEAGLELDLAKSPNRGVYEAPEWIRDVKFKRTASGQLALDFPEEGSAQQLLELLQETPEWNSTEAMGDEEILVDEAADLVEPVLPQEPAPTMDPATPEFKRHAVVKADPSKKPFDFMSNRPTPRTAPVEPAHEEKVAENVTAEAEPLKAPVAAPPPSKPSPAFETLQIPSKNLQKIEERAQALSRDFAALKQSINAVSGGNKWRSIAITDPALKFALYKRLNQLTGIHISDPHLNAANSLGDIYGYLCAAARPKTTSLYKTIQVEARKAEERKQQGTQEPRKKADLDDLLALGNVKVSRTRPGKVEKRTRIGLQKAVNRALSERRLRTHQVEDNALESSQSSLEHEAPWLRSLIKRENAHTLSRTVPDVEKPLSSRAASLLANKTKKEMDEERERQRQMN